MAGDPVTQSIKVVQGSTDFLFSATLAAKSWMFPYDACLTVGTQEQRFGNFGSWLESHLSGSKKCNGDKKGYCQGDISSAAE
jgi:hypothetical protein